MNYHIDTGLIYEKFNLECDCPLCEIQKKVEEQFINEFLNDACMDESSRLRVKKLGFCEEHYEKLFKGQNKLSLALEIKTRLDKYFEEIKATSSTSKAKKQAKFIEHQSKTCVICDLLNESMIKYYKTIAEMFYNEKNFIDVLCKQKGFCLPHYKKLIEYSSYASLGRKNYVNVISMIEQNSLKHLIDDLQFFCDKHDYRNQNLPFGNSEQALLKAKQKLFGDK